MAGQSWERSIKGFWGIRCLSYVGNYSSQCCECDACVEEIILTLTLWYLVNMLWSWICWCLYMYTCLYVCHVIKGHDFFYASVLCIYIFIYVCLCMTGSSRIILVEEWLLMQVNGMKRFLVRRNKVGRATWQIYGVCIMWIWFNIMCLYYVYVYVMDRLRWGIHQLNQSSVIYDMLGQAWKVGRH